jgi:transglutaminase-like putative cysteine protease
VEVRYEASVAVDRDLPALENLHQLSPHRLPGDAVKFLLSSRYCFSNQFLAFVEEEFGGTEGGARIAAIRDWLNTHIAYSPGVSGPQTTAVDTFHARAGVCRDFAHMLVTLARASSIPARYVSCYAPGVTPQDFHAVAQVYLANPQGTGGDWHLVDATGMADLEHAAIIGVGRDAADVAFVTSFAPMQFEYVKVDVARG